MTAEEYVATVLDEMPAAARSRAHIATELRAHIAERVAAGRPLDEVLRQLGDPRALAESYLSAEPLIAASIGQRVIAKVIDVLVIAAVIVPLALLTALTVPREALFVALVLLVAFCSTFLLGVYTIVAELSTGQTVGKRVGGIHVVQENGRRLGIGQAIVRQLPMVLNVYWIDAMFALFTDKRQRAFELLSKTRVVLAPAREADHDHRAADRLPAPGRPAGPSATPSESR